MQAPTAAALATVGGMVQGVGFRWSTRRIAADLGVSGWVRNRPDGSVEVWAQGPSGAVDELLAFLGHGPPGAIVETLEVGQVEPDETLEGFHITF